MRTLCLRLQTQGKAAACRHNKSRHYSAARAPVDPGRSWRCGSCAATPPRNGAARAAVRPGRRVRRTVSVKSGMPGRAVAALFRNRPSRPGLRVRHAPLRPAREHTRRQGLRVRHAPLRSAREDTRRYTHGAVTVRRRTGGAWPPEAGTAAARAPGLRPLPGPPPGPRFREVGPSRQAAQAHALAPGRAPPQGQGPSHNPRPRPPAKHPVQATSRNRPSGSPVGPAGGIVAKHPVQAASRNRAFPRGPLAPSRRAAGFAKSAVATGPASRATLGGRRAAAPGPGQVWPGAGLCGARLRSWSRW